MQLYHVTKVYLGDSGSFSEAFEGRLMVECQDVVSASERLSWAVGKRFSWVQEACRSEGLTLSAAEL